jgi:hypothetical protein
MSLWDQGGSGFSGGGKLVDANLKAFQMLSSTGGPGINVGGADHHIFCFVIPGSCEYYYVMGQRRIQVADGFKTDLE